MPAVVVLDELLHVDEPRSKTPRGGLRVVCEGAKDGGSCHERRGPLELVVGRKRRSDRAREPVHTDPGDQIVELERRIRETVPTGGRSGRLRAVQKASRA